MSTFLQHFGQQQRKMRFATEDEVLNTEFHITSSGLRTTASVMQTSQQLRHSPSSRDDPKCYTAPPHRPFDSGAHEIAVQKFQDGMYNVLKNGKSSTSPEAI
jgi:hypothetical protein